MKNLFSLSGKVQLAFMIACLSMIVVLSSCLKEPTPAPVGEAKIRYVNAVPASSAQDFFINGRIVNSLPVMYGEVSDYVTISSGNNEFVFADAGTQIQNTGVGGNIPIDGNFTFFYVNSLSLEKNIAALPNDMTLPAAGKARVRFFHLNNLLNNSIAVNISGGAQLNPAIGFASASSYYEVDPGTQFTVAATGVTNAPIVNAGIVAGKIYTIWFGGTTGTELISHVIVQN